MYRPFVLKEFQERLEGFENTEIMNESVSTRSFHLRLVVGFLALCLLVLASPLHATVTGWGNPDVTNNYGQLTIPTNLIAAKAVAAGGWHGLVVTKTNTVFAWGLNDYGQTNVPPGLTNVVAVAGGFDHSLALRADGTVVAWGIVSNLYAGDPDWFGQADVPPDATNVVAISAGAFHSLALKSNGTVEAWGYDFYGQCDVPAGLSNVTAIACGGYFSLALKADGTVVGWGDNYYGQTNLPPDLTNVVAIAGGGVHGLALKSGGTVEGWGARGTVDFTQDFGQETPPSDLTNAVGIAAGFFHSLAVLSDGTVRQWGDTSLGQTNPPSTLNPALAVAGGYAHSYALINDKPVIVIQPTNIISVTNHAVSFVAQVSGVTPQRAIWWKNISPSNAVLASLTTSNGTTTTSFTGGNIQGSLLTNQLGARFTLNLLASYNAMTNPGTYAFYLVASNFLGSVTSSVANLTVMAPPKITNQPASLETNVGATVFFTVGNSGSGPLSYTWLLNGTPLNLANPTNVLELDNVSTNDAGNYQVVVSNAVGVATSSIAILAVDGTPIIVQQPTNTTVILGSNAVFTAAAVGADPLTYQWYFQPQTNSDASAIPDGTSASYGIFNAQTSNSGMYFLIVSNGYGSVTSSVVTLSVVTPPIFVIQPADVISPTNHAASFVAQVSGATPLRATWFRNTSPTNVQLATLVTSNGIVSASFTGGNAQGSAFTNQPGAQFTLNLLATYNTMTNPGTYGFYLVVTNALGVVTSSVANLTVMLPPKITSQPTSVATNVGATVFFTVGASGGGTLSYTWLLNGTPLNLSNPGNVLELDNVSTNDAGNYQVVVSNAVGVATSSMATLTVDGTPIIIQQPTNTTVILGSNAVFTAIAAGADVLNYQWYFLPQTNTDAGAIPDGTNSSYELDNAQTNNAGWYFLIVSNGFGSVTSSVVTLSVSTPPMIVSQPADVFSPTNRPVSFVAVVSGVTPQRSTWWRVASPSNVLLASVFSTNGTITTSFVGGNVQGSLLTNQPGAKFTLNLLATYNAMTNPGTYGFYVVVTNALGVATSSVANLTVMAPPKIFSQPTTVATNVGATALFTVGASGSQPLSYTWLLNGTPLNLANPSNVLELDNISTNDAGSYQLVITNAVGMAASTPAQLYLLVNGSKSAPFLYLISHDLFTGDGIMIALEAGRNYRVQTSPDMMTWTDLTNFLSHASLVTFTNAISPNTSSQFYRVVTP
jgi:hypothetical protein